MWVACFGSETQHIGAPVGPKVTDFDIEAPLCELCSKVAGRNTSDYVRHSWKVTVNIMLPLCSKEEKKYEF